MDINTSLSFEEATDIRNLFTLPEGWGSFDNVGGDELQANHNDQSCGITIECSFDADAVDGQWEDCSSFTVTLQDAEEITPMLVAIDVDGHAVQDVIDLYAEDYAKAVKAAHAVFMVPVKDHKEGYYKAVC